MFCFGQNLLSVVDRSMVLFDSPHVGLRGAGLFPSVGKIDMTDDPSVANVSLVASPDVATVTTLRNLKPGEKLVALRRRARCRGNAAEVLSSLTVDPACPNWSEWLNELVAAVNETVFSVGTPVVDDPSKWPAMDVLSEHKAVWLGAFVNDAYAISFLSTCMLLGAKNSKPLESSAEELQKLAFLVGKYPRELMLREKSFPKPWLSTFYANMLKFYRISFPVAFQGQILREINA